MVYMYIRISKQLALHVLTHYHTNHFVWACRNNTFDGWWFDCENLTSHCCHQITINRQMVCNMYITLKIISFTLYSPIIIPINLSGAAEITHHIMQSILASFCRLMNLKHAIHHSRYLRTFTACILSVPSTVRDVVLRTCVSCTGWRKIKTKVILLINDTIGRSRRWWMSILAFF